MKCTLRGCARPAAKTSSGRCHPFCCKEHARKGIARGEWRPESTCAFPGCLLPCYVDGSKVHTHCGKTHAAEHGRHLAQQEQKMSATSSSSTPPSLILSFALDELDRATAESLQYMEQTRQRDWECAACTLVNLDTSSVCEACFSARTGSPQQHKKARVDRALELEAMERLKKTRALEAEAEAAELETMNHWNKVESTADRWTCSTCTTQNRNSECMCRQCSEPKLLAQNLSWPCPCCTFDNCTSDKQCYMCGASVPAHITVVRGRQSACGIPGCGDSVSHYGFCSKKHFDLGNKRQIVPPAEDGVEVVFVGGTGDITAHLLRTSHPKHANVKAKFLESWLKKSSGKPRVER